MAGTPCPGVMGTRCSTGQRESGFADICEYLIALGADVSHIDAFGRTALDCAQEVDEREVVALFNEHMEAIPSMACLTMTTAHGLAQPRRSRKRTLIVRSLAEDWGREIRVLCRLLDPCPVVLAL